MSDKTEFIRKVIEQAAGMAGSANPFAPFGSQALVKACKACGQKNRIVLNGKQPRCGKCGLPL